MAARIAGTVSRAAAGLRKAKSRSTRITPAKGGVVFHWGASSAPADHSRCAATWRQYQSHHMSGNGWADIAYSMGVCPHGYVFAGRGAGVRSAANGTNDGNQNNYAVCYLGGPGKPVTQAALDAFEWCVADLRSKGAGDRVRPHRDFTGSECPGSQLHAHARRLDRQAIVKGAAGGPAPAVPAAPPADTTPGARTLLYVPGKSQQSGPDVEAVQRWAGFTGDALDGFYGPKTVEGVQRVQTKVGVQATGVVDAATWKHYAAWVAWQAKKKAESEDAVRDDAARKEADRRAARNRGVVTKVPRGSAWDKRTGSLSQAANGGKKHGGVAKLQAQLKARGYYLGLVDGKYGPSTTSSVRAFQRDLGVEATGVVGPWVWESAWTRQV